MRLGIVTSLLSSAAGGLENCVPNLAHHLAATGNCDPEVFGVLDPNDPAEAGTWGPIVHAGHRRPPNAFHVSNDMLPALERSRPNVTDVQGLWTFPSLVNLKHCRRLGTPYLVTPHGMLDPWARERSRWKKWLVRKWFEDAHLAEASCLRATAEMEAEHFRSFGLGNPIAIVPNGVDTPPLRPAPSMKGLRRVLFLSRLHPKKGLPILLRTWARLQNVCPEWELVIAGPDEAGHKDEMQALSARLGLERVLWRPPVRGSEKDALYRSADLFVLPTHAENFGLVIAEALARGVPVITTRNAPWSGLRDKGCGWWIDLSEEALLDALTEATSKEASELSDMGRRGHAWMERDFAWPTIAQNMLEVYRWVQHGGALPTCVSFA